MKELEEKHGFVKGHKVLRLRGGLVSQGSDCDSDGLPGYMQGGCDENDEMELIVARREVEDFPVLVEKVISNYIVDDVLSPRSTNRRVKEEEMWSWGFKMDFSENSSFPKSELPGRDRVLPSSSGRLTYC